MAGSITKEALAIIAGTSPNACRLHILVTKMVQGWLPSITETEISNYLHQIFQQLTTKKL